MVVVVVVAAGVVVVVVVVVVAAGAGSWPLRAPPGPKRPRFGLSRRLEPPGAALASSWPPATGGVGSSCCCCCWLDATDDLEPNWPVRVTTTSLGLLGRVAFACCCCCWSPVSGVGKTDWCCWCCNTTRLLTMAGGRASRDLGGLLAGARELTISCAGCWPAAPALAAASAALASTAASDASSADCCSDVLRRLEATRERASDRL